MHRIATLLSTVALTLPAVAVAQVGPTPSSTSAATAPGDIVVTAQRREERLKDVPLTVVAVTSKTLEKAGVTTLRDLQNVVSGFTYGGQAVTTQPAIRGVSTLVGTIGSENPNALYVDGIYMSTQAVLSNDIPDVDRIEVLKGPQGTLFGRNATGGAIQLFTRDPSFTTQGSFTAEGSYYPGSGSSRSAGRVNLRGFVTGQIVDGLVAASLSGGYDRTPGYGTDDATGQRAGLSKHETVRGKILLTPADNLKITAAAFYIDNNNELGAMTTPYKGLTVATAYPGSVVPTAPWHSAFVGDFPGAFVKQYGGSLRAAWSLDIGTLTSLTGYTKTRTEAFNETYGASGSTPCLLTFVCVDTHQTQHNRETSEELNFSSRKFGILQFVTGLYYYDARARTVSYANEIVASGRLIQDATLGTKAYAAYGEATLNPIDPLFITLGIRRSKEKHDDSEVSPIIAAKKRTFNSTTPRVSVRYEVTPQLNAYGTFSIGYKGGLTGITNTGNGFQPVAPEKLYAYEGGLKYASHNITLNGAFFYYDYKNKQEQTLLGTTVLIENTGPVRIWGFDFDASARINREFSLSANLSYIPVAKYLDFTNANGSSLVQSPCPGARCGAFLPGSGATVGSTFDASGNRLSRAPKVTSSATLSYEHKAEGGTFDASTTLYYSSTVFHDITETIRQKSYMTINAQAGFTFNDKIRVGIFGRNLSNKAYIVSGLASAGGFVVGYAPPRELGVSLGYSF